MRLGLLFLCAAGLSGCADRIDRRLADMVGQPEETVVHSLGLPTKTYEAGGRRFIAYDAESLDFAYGEERAAPGETHQPPGSDPAWLSGSGIDTRFIAMRCDTTFEIAQGRVRSVSQSGDGCD